MDISEKGRPLLFAGSPRWATQRAACRFLRAAVWTLAVYCLALGTLAATAFAAPSPLSVAVENLPQKVRVRLAASYVLPRHYLRSTGKAGDVLMCVPGRPRKAINHTVNSGGVGKVTVQAARGDVRVLVQRSAVAGYRSSYAKNGRELVLEVDKVDATPQRVTSAPKDAAPLAFPIAPTMAARSRQDVAGFAMSPLRPAIRPGIQQVAFADPAPFSPALPAAKAQHLAAVLPGSWKVFGNPGTTQKLVTLDFVQADIQDVLKALAVQSGSNVLVAPKVEGKVTVGLRNVTPEQALEYIVRLAGLAYGLEDNTYVVCPRDQIASVFPAGTRGRILFPPTGQLGGATTAAGAVAAAPKAQVVHTNRVPASEVKAVLTRLMPDLQAETHEKNLLVLVGSPEQIQSAQTVITTLDNSFPEPPRKQLAPAQMPRLEIETYTLKHVGAVDAGRILEGFMRSGVLPRVVVTPAPAPAYPVQKGDAATATAATGAVATDPSQALLNLLYGGGNGAATAPAAGAQPGKPAAATAVPGAAPAAESTVSIPSDTITNTLLLIGTREDVAQVRGYLDRIDVAPQQVMIDVKVTDVSLTDSQQLGVTWNWGTFGIREIAPTGAEVVPNLNLGRFGHVPTSFNATLEALISSQKARLLANPRVAVLDGRTATIHVGDTVRYLAQRTVGINGTTVQIGSADVGVLVNVTPRIGGEDVITLDVRPKVNVITGYTATGDGGQVPNTSERSVETVVRMRSGETLAIGGLIRDEDVKLMQRVPGLGDLPLIGELFRFRNTRRVSSEVLIFITPTLVPDPS